MGKQVDYEKIAALHAIIIENELSVTVSDENLLLVCLKEIISMRGKIKDLEEIVDKLNDYHNFINLN